MNRIQFVTHLPSPPSLLRSLLLSGMMLGLLSLALSATARAQDACRECCDFSLAGTYLALDALVNNLTAGSNNIDIGNLAVAAESSTIRIGTAGTQTATFIAGIKGVPVTEPPVTVGSTGQLRIRTSSRRFKDEMMAMAKSSGTIFALEPVTFRYKHELDPDETLQFGLVAEEIAKVNPQLVECDQEGEPYSVRYEAVNATLLNDFLKEHRRGQEQDAKTEQQAKATGDLKAVAAEHAKEIAGLIKRLKDRAAKIQKVSAQFIAGESTTHLLVEGQ